MSEKVILTEEGYQQLEKRLEELKFVKRPEITERIKVARDFGDLSENAEYDEARNEQAKVEARIKELEEMIHNAVIVDETKIDTTIISVGSLVKVHDDDFDEDLEYHIVGSNEANPLVGKISDQSPIGKALIGMREGDSITVEAPGGLVHLTIGEVTRAHNNG